jgi:hypothetical protein
MPSIQEDGAASPVIVPAVEAKSDEKSVEVHKENGDSKAHEEDESKKSDKAKKNDKAKKGDSHKENGESKRGTKRKASKKAVGSERAKPTRHLHRVRVLTGESRPPRGEGADLANLGYKHVRAMSQKNAIPLASKPALNLALSYSLAKMKVAVERVKHVAMMRHMDREGNFKFKYKNGKRLDVIPSCRVTGRDLEVVLKDALGIDYVHSLPAAFKRRAKEEEKKESK